MRLIIQKIDFQLAGKYIVFFTASKREKDLTFLILLGPKTPK